MKKTSNTEVPGKKGLFKRAVRSWTGNVFGDVGANLRTNKALIQALMLGKREHTGPAFESFQELRDHYGLTREDQTSNYLAFRRTCLTSSGMLSLDLMWLAMNALAAHWSTAIVALGMSFLFAATATRYSIYCYHYRTQSLAPVSEWFRHRDAWWPVAWSAPTASRSR